MITSRIDDNNYGNRKKATMSDCVRHIEKIIADEAYEDYVIIGHSGAGPIAAKLAQSLRGKVRRAVYVAANLPGHGRTMIDSLPPLIRLINVIALRRMIRKDAIPYRQIEKMTREKFCNTCTEETIGEVLSKEMRSEPLCAITEKMNWDGLSGIMQTYMILTKDNTLSVARQRQMAANLSVTDFIEIESDHLVMFSHPAEFAAAVNGFLPSEKD